VLYSSCILQFLNPYFVATLFLQFCKDHIKFAFVFCFFKFIYIGILTKLFENEVCFAKSLNGILYNPILILIPASHAFSFVQSSTCSWTTFIRTDLFFFIIGGWHNLDFFLWCQKYLCLWYHTIVGLIYLIDLLLNIYLGVTLSRFSCWRYWLASRYWHTSWCKVVEAAWMPTCLIVDFPTGHWSLERCLDRPQSFLPIIDLTRYRLLQINFSHFRWLDHYVSLVLALLCPLPGLERQSSNRIVFSLWKFNKYLRHILH